MSGDGLIARLTGGLGLTGVVGQDVPLFLIHHGCPNTAMHSARVAHESERIAAATGVDPDSAETAGWLHDVSAVFPQPERARVARALGLAVLPEEDAYPMIVHQKLSAVLAREVFGVRDPAVLSAVGCHTTLRPGAGPLDKVLFVADKIEWDQPGVPPYREEMLQALRESLDRAAAVYLHALWQRCNVLPVVHPWMAAAHSELCGCA